MLELTRHVVRISARRDRTEINSAMLDALLDLFAPGELTIHRCYPSRRQTIAFACAGVGRDGQRFERNAYLPEHRYCRSLDSDPLLRQCADTQAPVLSALDGGAQRIVFPVSRPDQLLYLIDLNLPATFPPEQRIALMGLIEYFGNHIGLLDYGESDTLTGLASRRTFDKHLFELLGQAHPDETGRRRGSAHGSHWLAVCDIDHFKRVNDDFGHLIGDEVLIMASQVMRDSLRFDDQLFRFGGEEFIALLQPTDAASAQRVLERFRRNIEQQVFSRVGHVTISVGFSRLLANDTPTNAIDRADEALYYAKRHGRNRVDGYEELVASQAIAPRQPATGEIELF